MKKYFLVDNEENLKRFEYGEKPHFDEKKREWHKKMEEAAFQGDYNMESYYARKLGIHD